MDFSGIDVAPERLYSLLALTHLRSVMLQPCQQQKATEFGKQLPGSLSANDFPALTLYVKDRYWRTSGIVGANVEKLRVDLLVNSDDLKLLREARSLHTLDLGCSTVELLVKQISRIHSLQCVRLRKYGGSVAGLRWLRHMPNLHLVQVDGLEDEVAMSVLPKEVLVGRPVVRGVDC